MKLLWVLLLLPTAALAQSDWSAIQGLRNGRMLRVETASAHVVCSFSNATAESLDCIESRPQPFAQPTLINHHYLRADIATIRPRPQLVKRRFVLTGVVAGFVSAIVVGPILALPLVGIFALTGYIIGGCVDVIHEAIPQPPLYSQP